MTSEEQAAINQLSQLAIEGVDDVEVDWDKLKLNKEQLYSTMAETVYQEFRELEQDQNTTTVALATIVKLLADKYLLKTKLGLYDEGQHVKA